MLHLFSTHVTYTPVQFCHGTYSGKQLSCGEDRHNVHDIYAYYLGSARFYIRASICWGAGAMGLTLLDYTLHDR